MRVLLNTEVHLIQTNLNCRRNDNDTGLARKIVTLLVSIIIYGHQVSSCSLRLIWVSSDFSRVIRSSTQGVDWLLAVGCGVSPVLDEYG